MEGWSHDGAKEGEVVGGLEFEKGLRKTAQRGGKLSSFYHKRREEECRLMVQ